MKLSELKPGMVVEYADGTKRLVVVFDNKLMFTGETGYQTDITRWYNEDLTHKDFASSDIVKVYEVNFGNIFTLMTPSRLLWKRSEIIELSIEQIAKKFNVKPDQIRIKK